MLFKKPTFNFLVAGLGNPGMQYELTRHNAGFMAADMLASEYGAEIGRHKFDSLYCECRIKDSRLLLLKPQTYMNLSGKAVEAAASFYKIPPEKIIVMFDDTSLELGKIRIRRSGSDGGHNGMKDIIQLMGTDKIMRIKIGIGSKPHPDYDLKDWVLSRFTEEELKTLNDALSRTVKAVGEIVSKGIDSAMNRYNS